jgi:hypothetical protein
MQPLQTQNVGEENGPSMPTSGFLKTGDLRYARQIRVGQKKLILDSHSLLELNDQCPNQCQVWTPNNGKMNMFARDFISQIH